jgi:hypothetical protein
VQPPEQALVARLLVGRLLSCLLNALSRRGVILFSGEDLDGIFMVSWSGRHDQDVV